ncbi:MAG: chromate transporter [Treponema sp.]|nr:chromate transporter [Treponema sp.]
MIYLNLFLTFLKIGCFSFGGAYGAIPLIRDAVIAQNWLDDETLAYMIGVSESTPGPIMLNLATYVGISQAGVIGALLATTAVVLPSFIIILLVTACFNALLKNKVFQVTLQGVKPCIIGIICATGLYMTLQRIGLSSVHEPVSCYPITSIGLVLSLAAVLFGPKYILKKKLHPILFILLSAVLGAVVFTLF